MEVRSAASVEKATASHFDGLLAKAASRSVSLNKAANLKVSQACLLSTCITYLALIKFVPLYLLVKNRVQGFVVNLESLSVALRKGHREGNNLKLSCLKYLILVISSHHFFNFSTV